MGTLLAVDLGLRTGLALYGQDGRLCWYRSKNFGSSASLRRGVYTLLNTVPDIIVLVIEGGGELARIWEKEAVRKNIPVRQIRAEVWREALLYPREQITGLKAKHYADDRARRIIKWSGIARPTSMRHDTAEAILIGLWAVIDVGWLEDIPTELKR